MRPSSAVTATPAKTANSSRGLVGGATPRTTSAGSSSSTPSSSDRATITNTDGSRREASPPKKSEAPHPIAAAAANRIAISAETPTTGFVPAKYISPGQRYQQNLDCRWYAHYMQSIAEMPFIAGHVALDFVNTAEERGHPDAGDVLITPADLRLWGRRYGLISSSAPAGSKEDEQAELDRAREARELLYAIFFANVHGAAPSEDQLAQLARFLTAAYDAGTLQPAEDG